MLRRECGANIIRAADSDLPLWCLQQYFSSVSDNQDIVEKLLECRAAAGDLESVVWLSKQGISTSRAVTAAVTAGQKHVVEYLWLPAAGSNKNPWDRQVLCHAAAKHGQLEMLKYLSMQLCCPVDAGVCAAAAAGGHLHILKWLRKKGCSWCSDTCFEAAAAGHLHVLQYVVAAGCPYDAATSLAAALKGQMEVMVWLQSLVPPCELAPGTVAASMSSGNRELAQWLKAQGSP